ncbi:MAG: deoxyhypusine synthase family protein [Planctomycetales bacterium]|nr:deoxyhypusine synthase family protein [Planctomycetales bacterium]
MTRELRDGREDGLRPLQSLALDGVSSFADLLRGMSDTAFAGRQLGEAFAILCEIAERPQCRTVLTVSGAMTVAKQGRILCDLVDAGLIDAIVSTGALMAHGLTESIGLTHYRYDPSKSDERLFQLGYNRIYDTLEMEANLNDVEKMVRSVLREVQPEDGVWSSARLCAALGERLDRENHGAGILRSCHRRGVPVFIPAFSDSELGLDVATWAMSEAQGAQLAGESDPNKVFNTVPAFNPFLDLQQYARFIGEAEELAILTIGGGVPRNWAQQVAPYYDITNDRVGTELAAPRFRFGIRICPEPVHWGGLSGCTYSEGVSWGKFMAPQDGGRFAEVMADATIALPLLAKGILEHLAPK